MKLPPPLQTVLSLPWALLLDSCHWRSNLRSYFLTVSSLLFNPSLSDLSPHHFTELALTDVISDHNCHMSINPSSCSKSREYFWFWHCLTTLNSIRDNWLFFFSCCCCFWMRTIIKSFYWICYNIASVFWIFPTQGWSLPFSVSPALSCEFFTTSAPLEALGRGPHKITRRERERESSSNQVPPSTSQSSFKDGTQEVS